MDVVEAPMEQVVEASMECVEASIGGSINFH